MLGVTLLVASVRPPLAPEVPFLPQGRWRIAWLAWLVVLVGLPLLLPLKAAYYYAVLGNSAIIMRTGDVYKDLWEKTDDEPRTHPAPLIAVAVVLAGLPLVWRWPVSTWVATFVTPVVVLFVARVVSRMSAIAACDVCGKPLRFLQGYLYGMSYRTPDLVCFRDFMSRARFVFPFLIPFTKLGAVLWWGFRGVWYVRFKRDGVSTGRKFY
jgi:hypothetical protein